MGKANVFTKRRQRRDVLDTTIFLTTDLTSYDKMMSLRGFFVCLCYNIVYRFYANGEKLRKVNWRCYLQ